MNQFENLSELTCKPTLIFLVKAPGGKTAWTWLATLEIRIPPSAPMTWTSCLILVTIAKYCGNSVVNIRVIRPLCDALNCGSENKSTKFSFVCFLNFPGINTLIASYVAVLIKNISTWMQRTRTTFTTMGSVEESVVIVRWIIVFFPRFTIFTSQNNYLSLLALDRCEMGHID